MRFIRLMRADTSPMACWIAEIIHPQTGVEVLVNLASLTAIGIDYVDANDAPLPPRQGQADPAARRVFAFKVEGVVFRVRADSESPGAAYLRKLYDDATK